MFYKIAPFIHVWISSMITLNKMVKQCFETLQLVPFFKKGKEKKKALRSLILPWHRGDWLCPSVFPVRLSPVPHRVTSSRWIPGWRSRMPASRCHWRCPDYRRHTTQQSFKTTPGLCLSCIFIWIPGSFLPLTWLEPRVWCHQPQRKPWLLQQMPAHTAKGARPRQQRRPPAAPLLARPCRSAGRTCRRPPELAHSSWRNTQRHSVEDLVPPIGYLMRCKESNLLLMANALYVVRGLGQSVIFFFFLKYFFIDQVLQCFSTTVRWQTTRVPWHHSSVSITGFCKWKRYL